MITNPHSVTEIPLVTLFIKLAVMGLLAGFIARFDHFRRLLFIEQRTPKQKLLFAVSLGTPFMLGVLARLIAKYQGTDLNLEITVVAGLMGGTIVGLVVGMMVSLPALFAGEILAPLMAVLYAVVAGSARWVCPNKEEIWKFSPFIDLSLYRSIKQRFQHPALDWQVLFWLICLGLEITRITIGRLAPRRLFFTPPTHTWTFVLIVVSTLIAVALPVRIWNTTRMERKLEYQDKALMQARVDTLISQINPHFLFNTLNTVSSLIRVDPDKAREVLRKLATILRTRLKMPSHFVTLKQELDFIDDYLDIEVVRFGNDKLQIVKKIEADALEAIVPSMLLQPLVENAIRHGIGPKIEGGTITIRSARHRGRVLIEVADDGVGIAPEKHEAIFGSGIGISNVQERLKVIFGEDFSFKVISLPGQGTSFQLEIPELLSQQASQPAIRGQLRE